MEGYFGRYFTFKTSKAFDLGAPTKVSKLGLEVIEIIFFKAAIVFCFTILYHMYSEVSAEKFQKEVIRVFIYNREKISATYSSLYILCYLILTSEHKNMV
mmetsp:Transcript_3456/g.4133  ORF Transcript_3456/g.4133 Transcript_3456/m.4133 type:complete len:100 (-) Transcript_3456:176-475(-)